MNLYLNHSYNTFRKPINKKIWVKSWTLRSEQQSNTIDISNVVQVLPVVIKVFVILHSGLLVLLVLGDEVVHVGLSLGELHLVHALTLKVFYYFGCSYYLNVCPPPYLCTNEGKPSS